LVNRLQAAEYVGSLTAELAVLVRRHQLSTLGYLLDMVRLEAEQIAQQDGDGASSSSPPDPLTSQPSAARK
jgi:hypothetical protein